MKSLEKDRSRRYESASALAADIQRYLSDEPVLACPPTTMYRFQKFARKHKPAFATAAAIALCLLLGTTVSAWQAIRATAAEEQAVANAATAQEKEQEAIKQRDEVKALADKLAAKEQQLERTLYAAHMNLARHAWEAGLTGEAEKLLLQHRPKAGETDLRGFEWHYLYRLCHSDLLTLRGHTSSVYTAIFSPDGKRLASASADRTVKLWDAETGKELRTLKGHTGAVDSVAFSPDGKRLASCTGYDGPGTFEPGGLGLKVWNVETGEELLYMPEAYSPVSYSPDGKRLATTYWSDGNRTVKVWDNETGRELLAWKAHDKNVKRLAFSPDGKSLASADSATAKVWNAQTGQELLSLKGTGYYGLNFSADGKRLVTAGGDGFARVWDAQTGEKVGEKLLSLKGVANLVALSPDGKHLAAEPDVRGERTVYIFDLQTGKEVREIKGAGRTVSYSLDGRRLASISGFGVKIWDAQKDQENLVIRPTDPWYVAMSPDSKLVASGSGLNVIVWDARTGQPALTLTGHTVPVFGVAFSPDGKRIVSGGFGRIFPGGSTGPSPGNPPELKIWDAQTGQKLLTIKAKDDNDVVYGVAFSPDGKRVASAQSVWDAQTGEEVIALKKGRRNGGISVAFSPDGQYLASGDIDGAKLWNAQTGQELRTLPGGATPFCPVVAFSPDSKRLAGGGFGGKLKVWDVESGQEVLDLIAGAGRFGFAFSPDGKRLVSSQKIWDAETGQELLSLDGGGYGIAFSPDGHLLACNTGGRLKIFDATPLPEKP